MRHVSDGISAIHFSYKILIWLMKNIFLKSLVCFSRHFFFTDPSVYTESSKYLLYLHLPCLLTRPAYRCAERRFSIGMYWKFTLKLNVVDKSIFLLEKSLIAFKCRKMFSINSYNQYSDIEHSVSSDFSDLHFESHLHVHVNVYIKG